MARRRNKHKWLLVTVIVSVAAILILRIMPKAMTDIHNQRAFSRATEQYAQGQYVDAMNSIQDMSDYPNNKRAYALYNLCKAHVVYYDYGNIEKAHEYIQSYLFRMPSEYRIASEETFINTVNSEYSVLKEAEDDAEEETYRDKITNGVPFIGMLESEIKNTSLGEPSSKIRHNNEMINGEVVLANLYDFIENRKVIFTARCVNGRVTQVWDKRNKTQSTVGIGKSRAASNSDPYNANDYSDEEDFYEDHYDDFYDFEDAEDYYNEHKD